ncbi:MAG: hypothetical protein AAGA03_08075 [Planctomycetota bacterium]
MKNPKRTRILVDPEVQWAIGRRVIGHWMLFALALVSLNVAISVLLAAGTRPWSESFGEALRSQIPIAIVIAALIPAFVRDTMKLSNRFAGPMYRLRTTLAQVRENQTPQPVSFRDGDFWQDVAGDFNVVLSELAMLRKQVKDLEGRGSNAGEQEETVVS